MDKRVKKLLEICLLALVISLTMYGIKVVVNDAASNSNNVTSQKSKSKSKRLVTTSKTCIIEGCENEKYNEGVYCHDHIVQMNMEMLEHQEPRIKAFGSGSGSSSSGSYYSSGSKKHSSSSLYDAGYNSVYEDEYYDRNRYKSDSHYATGVDDAMDDLDEDW